VTSFRGGRLILAVAAVALIGGSLTGCARGVLDGSSSPAAGVTASTTAPTPAAGSSGTSVQDIQNDLNSADSATSNAGGDVADADSSAATSDSP
jgi:hypothetical protein